MSKRTKTTRSGKTPSRPTAKKKATGFDFKQWENVVILLLLFLVFAMIYPYSFTSDISLNGDNVGYYLLGKSLSSGNGYTLISSINAPPHSHFPPGYPVILAVLMFISKSTTFLKCANGAMLLGSLFLSYRIFRDFGAKWQVALVSILLAACNYHLVKSSVTMMSEIPFLFFSLLSLWCLMRIDFSEKFLKNKMFYIFIFLLSFVFHIRTAGIALFAGILFYLLLEKQWKGSLATFVGFILLGLPWFLRGKILGLASSYQNQLFKINPYQPELGDAGLMDFVTRFGNNFTRYVSKEIPSGILPYIEINYQEPAPWTGWAMGIVIILLALFGMFKLTQYRSLLLGYIGGTFAILMLWVDVWFGTRFIMPLLPIIIFLVVFAVSWFLEKGLGKLNLNGSYASFLLLPFLFAFFQKYQANADTNWQSYPMSRANIEANNKYSLNWQNYIKVAEYAKKNLKETDIIACRKPQIFHIFSDRYTCNFPYVEDDKKFLEIMKDRQATYVVVEQLGFSATGKYLIPAVNKNLGNFKQVLHLKNPDTYLLKFTPPQ